MWFDADAALKKIKCARGSNARQIVIEPELGWISTNSTISTATFLKYEIFTSSKEMIRESLMMRLNLYFTNITFSMNLVPMRGVKQARQHFCKPNIHSC